MDSLNRPIAGLLVSVRLLRGADLDPLLEAACAEGDEAIRRFRALLARVISDGDVTLTELAEASRVHAAAWANFATMLSAADGAQRNERTAEHLRLVI